MTISRDEWSVLRSVLMGMAESERANREAGQSPGPLFPETLETFVGDVDKLVS